MEYVALCLGGLTIAIIILSYILSQRKPRNFPPGPYGIPFLGHLLFLGLEPYKKLIAWKPKYGPIVGLDFGSYPCVIISDYSLGKQAFAQSAFAGRPNLRFSAERSGGGPPAGIALTTGREWQEQRGFALRRLREIGGFGTRSMESGIMGQVQELVQALRPDAEAGRPISTSLQFNIAVVNSLWVIIAGTPFKQGDPEVARLTRIFVDALANHNIFTMLPMFMPWVYDYFPSWITGVDEVERLYKPFVQFIQPYLDEHHANHVPGQPRDFIDAYIDEMKKTGAGSGSGSGFHHSGLLSSVMDLFQAGAETTARTLTWMCLLLASYPVVQARLAAEIQAVLRPEPDSESKSGRPSLLADRKQMPYTEAVIHEVMRFRPFAPLTPFHSTTQDVHFHGYDIPKDTMVFINTWDAHFSKDLWGNPEEFHPERWLSQSHDGNGLEFVRREGFLAFSTGKRVCLGEQLARDQLFLFTVGIFQAFRIDVDGSAPPPSLEPILGGSSLVPKPHRLVFTLRDG